MRFDVLGPMRVTDDLGTRPVAGVRQRILLGALLAHAGSPLRAEKLAEIVWDGAPTERALHTLRTYISRLRSGIGSDAAARIVTRDCGYLAEVGPNDLDTLVFEALFHDVGRAIRAANWAKASSQADQALALWRGIPLEDVPSQVLHDLWLPRLNQQYLQLTEWQIEAELNLGRHEHLVPRLRQLTAEHPLREHFHAQLMLALTRCGRQAESLAAYQDARRLIVGELGIEPGPKLRHLHEQVLASEDDSSNDETAPHSSATRMPGGTVVTAVPRQLPVAAGHFTGRDGELDQIISLHELSLRPDSVGDTMVISAIDGMAGIGKTALAVRAAHRLSGEFPDGQLFIDLHGYTQGYPPRDSAVALGSLLRSLGVPARQIPAEPEECAALYRQRLAGTRTLIVLDNAHNEAQVRPLLPGTPGCLVIVTSRRRLRGLHDAHIVALDVLPETDALMLLGKVTVPTRTMTSDGELAEIAGLCGRLPLALRIAGALLRHRPAWTPQYLAGLLRDEQQRLATLADGDHDLDAVFGLSYSALSERQRLLFRRLALIPGSDFEACAAAALLDAAPAAASRLLEDLVDHNLLIEHAPGRYRLHDLIRAHARTLVSQEPQTWQDSALDRLLHYYAHAAQSASALIARYPRPVPEGPVPAYIPVLTGAEAARAWLYAERENIEAAYLHASALKLDAHLLALTTGLAVLLNTDGPFAHAYDLHQAAVETAERLGDPLAQATALTDLGIFQRLTGDLTSAALSLSHARDIAHSTGRRNNEATALTELSIVLRLTGDQTASDDAVRHALDLYRATGHRQGEATSLLDLGILLCMARDLTGAIDTLTRALLIFREVGFRHGEADALAELGVVARTNGDLTGAIDNTGQALAIYRSIGHRHGEATTLARLGTLQQLSGDQDAAGESFAQALEIYRALGQRSGEAYALTELGVAQLLSGNPREAARSQAQAMAIYREHHHRSNEAEVLTRYAVAMAATGDTGQALTLYRQALAMNRELSHPSDEATALEGLGECHLAAGEAGTCGAYLRQALEIYERLDMKPDIERLRARLAGLAPGESR